MAQQRMQAIQSYTAMTGRQLNDIMSDRSFWAKLGLTAGSAEAQELLSQAGYQGNLNRTNQQYQNQMAQQRMQAIQSYTAMTGRQLSDIMNDRSFWTKLGLNARSQEAQELVDQARQSQQMRQQRLSAQTWWNNYYNQAQQRNY